MSDVTSATRKRAGLLESAMLKLFTRSGRVLDVAEVGSAFRLVTIGGEAVRNVDWTPGDKVQISLGGWVQRTYTPIDWDSEAGHMRILIYLHAAGPGTHWAGALRKDDACIVFGPRKSLDLTRLASAAILFGDESCLGLAAALCSTVKPPSTQLLLEVSSLAPVQSVIEHWGFENAHLSVREVNDAHLTASEQALLAALQTHPNANIVLAGKASSIQRMSKLLKRSKIVSSRFQVRAYWATGKTGLD